jgi:uncharacterized membrane protein
MNSLEPLGLGVLAIVAMAIATVLMRVGGFWLMAYVPLTPRVRRMLEALPGSIVVAIVLPVIVKNGPVAVAAVVAAAIVMILRRNQVLAVAAGVTVAALVRYAAV